MAGVILARSNAVLVWLSESANFCRVVAKRVFHRWNVTAASNLNWDKKGFDDVDTLDVRCCDLLGARATGRGRRALRAGSPCVLLSRSVLRRQVLGVRRRIMGARSRCHRIRNRSGPALHQGRARPDRAGHPGRPIELQARTDHMSAGQDRAPWRADRSDHVLAADRLFWRHRPACSHIRPTLNDCSPHSR